MPKRRIDLGTSGLSFLSNFFCFYIDFSAPFYRKNLRFQKASMAEDTKQLGFIPHSLDISHPADKRPSLDPSLCQEILPSYCNLRSLGKDKCLYIEDGISWHFLHIFEYDPGIRGQVFYESATMGGPIWKACYEYTDETIEYGKDYFYQPEEIESGNVIFLHSYQELRSRPDTYRWIFPMFSWIEIKPFLLNYLFCLPQPWFFINPNQKEKIPYVY